MAFAASHFWRRQGQSDEHIRHGSVRSEQRSLRQKGLPPGGLRRFWPVNFVARRSQPQEADAPSPRLATGQKHHNERHRFYASDHLAVTM